MIFPFDQFKPDRNTDLPLELQFLQAASVHSLTLEEARSTCLMLMSLLSAERTENQFQVQTIEQQAIDLKEARQALIDRAETIGRMEQSIECLKKELAAMRMVMLIFTENEEKGD